jgi:hypothetical protein
MMTKDSFNGRIRAFKSPGGGGICDLGTKSVQFFKIQKIES